MLWGLLPVLTGNNWSDAGTLFEAATNSTLETKENNMAATEDKFARVIALLSLVASAAAVVVPYLQQRALQEELLKPELEWRGDGNYKLTGINLGEKGRVIQTPWRVILSNVGTQKLSVTRYTLSEGETPGALRYSGLDGGLSSELGVAVDLPVTLEGGETKVFILHIGAIVSPESEKILKEHAQNKSVTVEQGDLILAREGTDLYGNSVNLKEYGPAYIIEKDYSKAPKYWIEITTSRANSFRTFTSP
jgi:hypothetical protein